MDATGKGRGQGRGQGQNKALSHLKEIAKQTPRSPKAFLQETALLSSCPDQHLNEEAVQRVEETSEFSTDLKVSTPEENVPEQNPSQAPDEKNIDKDVEGKSKDTQKPNIEEEKEGKAANQSSDSDDGQIKEQKSDIVDEANQSTKTFDVRLLNSINCPEFIPFKASLNINAPEFVMPASKTLTTDSAAVDTAVTDAELWDSSGTDSFVIQLFQDTVYTLTFSPGDYDRVIDNLLETMLMFISEGSTMKEIVNILIEQAIQAPNFLYSAVRMIKLFLEKLEVNLQHSQISFKNSFYPSLKKVHDEMCQLIEDRSDPVSQERALNTILLFADLLCNIKVGDQLNAVFLKAVFRSIEKLKENPTKEMVQTLIKILKLTGPTLDMHKSSGQDIPEVDAIFNELKELSIGNVWLSNLENADELRKRFFAIYKLHSRNWDREPSETIKASSSGDGSSSSTFPDGSAVSSGVDWSEYYGGDDFDYAEEIREEYDDDFESFLRESGQA